MSETTKLKITFPSEDEDYWYPTFELFANGIDAYLYASVEDRNLIITGLETLTFSPATGRVAWTSALKIRTFVTGYYCHVPAGSITIEEGQIGYVELVRGLTENAQIELKVGNSVGKTDNALVLFFRENNKLYVRNGQILS
jgi:hypothetical protein